MGCLDILSRGSDAKTLKKGARGVCGTEIKCGWNLVSRGGIAWGRAYILHHDASLRREKNDRAEIGQPEYPELIITKAILCHVITMCLLLCQMTYWHYILALQQQSKVGYTGFVILTRKYEAQN